MPLTVSVDALMLTPPAISRSAPEPVVCEMVRLVRCVWALEVLSTTGAELPAGLSGAATMAQRAPAGPTVQDIVTDAAPASSDPAPTTVLLPVLTETSL